MGIAILLVVDSLTSYIVRDKIYTDSKQIPYREYAVVLGTAKFYSKDVINQYYKYRLEAAKQLVQEGKVNQLLLSGDNKTPYYNEPKTMTSDLLKMGIATSKIKQDYAGYTTFYSIIRAKKYINYRHLRLSPKNSTVKGHCLLQNLGILMQFVMPLHIQRGLIRYECGKF